MGYYINSNSKGQFLGYKKLDALIADGAIVTTPPTSEADWRPDLVCVLCGMFDAAGYAFSPQEMMSFADPEDNRQRVWLIYPHARKLSGYEAIYG